MEPSVLSVLKEIQRKAEESTVSSLELYMDTGPGRREIKEKNE